MARVLLYGLVLTFSYGLLGCNEALEPDPSALGYEYFPLTTSDYRIYDVTTKDYKIDGTINSASYQLKELIGAMSNTNGIESFRVERYIRSSEEEEWAIDSVWSARINTHQAIMVENNKPIIKLSFPIAEDRSWDGNAMNSNAFDQYRMDNIGFQLALNDIVYEKSLRLVKEELIDPCKITEDIIRVEMYASGIGMVYKQDVYRNYLSQPCDTIGIIEFGHEQEYILSDYSVSE